MASSSESSELNIHHLFTEIEEHFPHFQHTHPPVMNVNEASDQKLSLGAHVADKVADTVGSWPFIIVQSIVLACWLVLNITAWVAHWDPYPFILLNLALSFQAAYAAPFVMMSQNRQATKDRLMAENDYHTNLKSEEEICHVMAHLDHQDTITHRMLAYQEQQHKELLKRLERIEQQLSAIQA